MKGPRRLLVANARNSESSAPIKDLDFGRWFTDGRSSGLYLHVHHKYDDSIHRVYCKASDAPRLQFEAGELYWLVDAKVQSVTPSVDWKATREQCS